MLGVVASYLLACATRLKQGGVIVNEHTLSRAQTRFHLDVLGRWFEFIKLEELPERLSRRTSRPFCLLTFDDGKRGNFTETAPELERRGVPAVFYVPTAALSSGACLWFDQRARLIEKLGRCPPGLELRTLKQLPLEVLTDRLGQASAEYNVSLKDAPEECRPMSWEEARSLHRRGFIIGAHGATHAILTCETPQRAAAEIRESLAAVSRELGVPCQTFAFPNGNYSPGLARLARCCGATTVMTTEPMWADEFSSWWRLPRIQLFGQFSRAKIELKLALAAVRGVLTNPDGSGRVYRSIERESRRFRTTPAAQWGGSAGIPVRGKSRVGGDFTVSGA